MKKISFLLLPVFSFLFAGNLYANLAMDLGLGARATSLGGAFTAIADDYSAVFYNPAGLAQIPRADLSFMIMYAKPSFTMSNQDLVNRYHRIEAQRGIGGGVTYLDIPSVDMDPTFGAVVGLALNMKYVFGFLSKMYLGVAAYIPFESVLRLSTVSMTTTVPHFALYVPRLNTPLINAGLAYEISSNLSIGVGLNVLIGQTADAYGTATLDFSEKGIIGAINEPDVVYAINREIEPYVAPHAGILWKPIESLSVGLSYRGKMVVEISGINVFPVNLRDPSTGQEYTLLTALLDPLVFEVFLNPHQLNLGFAYQVAKKWRISVDIGWNKWSDYVEGLGRAPTKPFHDTYVPRLGIEYGPGENLTLCAGYFFWKSPVPDQDRESNFLDFTKHGFSLGGNYTFPKILRRRKLSIRGDLQYQFLMDRKIEKIDTGMTVVRNDMEFPEYGPDYEISGHIINIGIELILHF